MFNEFNKFTKINFDARMTKHQKKLDCTQSRR